MIRSVQKSGMFEQGQNPIGNGTPLLSKYVDIFDLLANSGSQFVEHLLKFTEVYSSLVLCKIITVGIED